MRWSSGTKSALPGVVTRGTKSVIDFFTAPSFQEGRGSGACAAAPLQPSAAARIVASASRLLMFTSKASKASNVVSLRMELRKASVAHLTFLSVLAASPS